MMAFRRSTKVFSFFVTAVACAGFGARAHALDLSASITCAMSEVFDCSSSGCTLVESVTVGVPDLLRIDPAAKTLTALDLEFGGAGSALDSLKLEGGKVAGSSRENDRSLAFAIDPVSGEAMFTITDLHLVLVGYGACAQH